MAVQNFGSGGGGFQLSPGVNISEVDLTTVTPAVDTTIGAFAGVFRWGPVNERTLVTSENDLVRKFGKPTNINPETFFTAANFLSYSNSLQLVRAANTSTQFAAIGGTGAGSASAALTVYNNNDYDVKSPSWGATDIQYIARWPGAIGNSLKVSMCENATQYTSTANLLAQSYTLGAAAGEAQGNTGLFNGPNTGLVVAVGSSAGVITLDGSTNGYLTFSAEEANNLQATLNTFAARYAVGDYLVVGTGTTQALKITSKSVIVGNTGGVNTGVGFINLTFDQPLKLSSSIDTDSVTRFWEYFSQVDAAPGRSTFVTVNGNTALQLSNTAAQNDEVHVIIADEDGEVTGNPGTILEVWQGLSRATDAKLSDGTSNYFKNVINEQSQFIWFADDRPGAESNTALNIATATSSAPLTVSLAGGNDQSETDIAFTAIANAYDQFVSPEDVDISLLITGRTRGGENGTQLANYLIDNIAEVRKDCVVFVSPEKTDVVNATSPETKVVEFRNSLRSSSYAVLDSGYKQQYDKYNDLYRWIPLNGDIAGLCVRTDNARDPWFSPAGTNRGQIRNSIKLAFNPNLAQRDLLYKNGINPVISLQGQGTVLFGDKTLLSKPSAFDRINVRRLFIVLQKAISTAAKSFLFEFNDEFTRTQFRNLVEPFLRDVQGRRGIYDFKVVCDETNNTPEVIDNNRFVGDIYIKPARSINYIQLNFVAVRSGIEFSEIVG
ncbi:tail sheath protein [uncultured Caudovirales phage]|uniref:Tail sheath protein n=1 Tax=uncultured Caudovirales phage TaxID=2100421 RepID=A0A6J5M9F5_9CAUD|nr:tail sheath protein [uncultured Caudovirales phage]